MICWEGFCICVFLFGTLAFFLISMIKSRLPRLHSCHLAVLGRFDWRGELTRCNYFLLVDGSNLRCEDTPDFVDAVLAVFIFGGFEDGSRKDMCM